jgi:periplasmic divalent cation tolerance protein
MSEGHLAVLVTAPDAEVAGRIARSLVEERLAACVNILPVRSVYTWEGKVEDASENMLVIKTAAAAWERLEARVKALHPYDVPEIVALPLARGSRPYLSWIDASVEKGGAR